MQQVLCNWCSMTNEGSCLRDVPSCALHRYDRFLWTFSVETAAFESGTSGRLLHGERHVSRQYVCTVKKIAFCFTVSRSPLPPIWPARFYSLLTVGIVQVLGLVVEPTWPVEKSLKELRRRSPVRRHHSPKVGARGSGTGFGEAVRIRTFFARRRKRSGTSSWWLWTRPWTAAIPCEAPGTGCRATGTTAWWIPRCWTTTPSTGRWPSSRRFADVRPDQLIRGPARGATSGPSRGRRRDGDDSGRTSLGVRGYHGPIKRRATKTTIEINTTWIYAAG